MDETREDTEIERISLWVLSIGAVLSLVRAYKLREQDIFFVSFDKIRVEHSTIFNDERLLPLCGYNNSPEYAKRWINELFSEGTPPLEKLAIALNNLPEAKKQNKRILRIVDSLSHYFTGIRVINNDKIEFKAS